MNKTIYIANEEQLVKLLDLLEKKSLSFSQWVTNMMVDFLERNNPEAKVSLGKCQFPRLKPKNLDCDYTICPILQTKLGGYAELAQKREFEAKENCLFRLTETL